MIAAKRCRGCGKSQPPDRFGKSSRSADGRNALCKKCDAAKSRAYAQERRRNNPFWKSDQHRTRRYSLTQGELEVWLSVPVCQHPYCKYRFKHDGDMKFDHHPTLGHVRGVLCTFHNATLRGEDKSGLDPSQDLRGLAEYYERDLERIREQG